MLGTIVTMSRDPASIVFIASQRIGGKLGRQRFDAKVGSLRSTVVCVEHILSQVSIANTNSTFKC